MVLVLILVVLCFGGMILYWIIDAINYGGFDTDLIKMTIVPTLGLSACVSFAGLIVSLVVGVFGVSPKLSNSVEFAYAKGTSDGVIFFNENNEVALDTDLSEAVIAEKLSYDFERQIYMNDENLRVNKYTHSKKTRLMWAFPNRVEYRVVMYQLTLSLKILYNNIDVFMFYFE